MTTTGSTRLGSGEMFDAIAARYDLLNRVISLGVDQRWRRRMVEAIEARPGHRVLDLATGTADVAIQVAKKHPDTTIVGLDPSAKMLEVGRDKIAAGSLATRVSLELGDAQQLPFEDASFDASVMAFGIRNVPDRGAALREMARVVRPGGRVVILELNEPRSGILGPLARFHVHTIVPLVGAALSGSKEYSYLQASIAAFPSPEDFAAQMAESGLEVLRVEPQTFGVACLFVATPRARG
jgi:demethylmenaquinone methyltransferase/2-methoxy-6-polyprenyl-1,4-benzoquinol methylase